MPDKAYTYVFTQADITYCMNNVHVQQIIVLCLRASLLLDDQWFVNL